MEFIVFAWIGCAVACWIIANSKARFAGVWLVLGLMFGIFALIAVIIVPSLDRPKGEPTPDTHIKCPDCREFVIKDARKCKHCGCILVPQA